VIKSDKWITERAIWDDMIIPFEGGQVKASVDDFPVISYGLSSYGYDVRLDNTFKVFAPRYDKIGLVNPKEFDASLVQTHEGAYCIIPPNSFVLGQTVERLKIPRDVLVICVGKSTYARCGLIVNVTPLEPEWEGTITIEISNTTPLPAIVYAQEGIAQLLFFQSDDACGVSYADKAGKYMGQHDVTLPRL